MNFDKTLTWIVGIVVAASLSGELPKLQLLIWKAQAHIIHESRTSTWGSPRFFPESKHVPARRRSVKAD
jgi:hypothetical protein